MERGRELAGAGYGAITRGERSRPVGARAQRVSSSLPHPLQGYLSWQFGCNRRLLSGLPLETEARELLFPDPL